MLRLWAPALVIATLVVAGCSATPPTFPRYDVDAGWECGDEDDAGLGACPTGQVCLQHFCYARCDARADGGASPCGPLERCSSDGICLSAGDAGTPDAGTPDPCMMAGCTAPTPYCRNGACLQCDGVATTDCGGPTPICDVGRGICVAFAPALCGPCNNDLDCMGAGPPSRCVTRRPPDPAERSCLPTCDVAGLCPQGFTCNLASMNCEPTVGSCTGMRAAIEMRGCADDGGCAPAGATFSSGLFMGACFDGTGTGPLTCHHPCGVPEHCPPPQICNTARGFCL